MDYGSSDYDLRHRFTFSLTYNLPSRKAPGQMLQGWVVNSVVTLQSGMPWGTMDTNNDFYGNLEYKNSAQERWDFTGNPADFTSGPSNFPCFCATPGSTWQIALLTVGGVHATGDLSAGCAGKWRAGRGVTL